jgi:hypothetical protein
MSCFRVAFLLAAVLTCVAPFHVAFAQDFPEQAPLVQQNFSSTTLVPLSETSMPQLLQGQGLTIQEVLTPIGKVWALPNQNLGTGSSVVVMLTKNRNNRVNGFLMCTNLGSKVNPNEPGLAAKLLGLMDFNGVNAPYAFSYDAKTGYLQLTYEHMMSDSSQVEVTKILRGFTGLVAKARPYWSRQGLNASNLGNNPPAQQPVGISGFVPPVQQPAFTAPVQQPVFSPPAQPVVMSIAQSTWTGSETLQGYGKLTFQFRASGEAVMIDAQSTLAGSWAQHGNQVTIRFGDCIYQGTIQGQTLSGTGRITRNNVTWTFTVTRNS